MFETHLEAGNVLLGLLDEGQMWRQLSQAIVRLDTRLIDRRRAGGDKNCIELVVLGPAQMHAGIGFDLDRLQDQNREALVTQIADHAAFVAAAGLDADARDAGLRQFGSKTPPTSCCVVELPVLIPPMNRDIKFDFRCIDPCRYANLRHLRRPRLVERTMCSGNHPGPMKALTRSRYAAAQ